MPSFPDKLSSRFRRFGLALFTFLIAANGRSLKAFPGEPLTFDLTTVPVQGVPQSLVVADFDHDGNLDLAVTVNDAGDNGSVQVLLGNGNGAFRSAGLFQVGKHATRIVTADFNRDGKLDLAVSLGEDAGYVYILLGNGDGTFQPAINSGTQTPGGQVPSALTPGLAIADINGDGIPDLVLGPYTFGFSSEIRIRLGKGNGNFQFAAATQLTRLDSPSVAVLDFKADGKDDLFVTGSIVHGHDGELLLFDGQSDGSLTQSFVLYTTAEGYFGPGASGDLNGDGRKDYVALQEISGLTDKFEVDAFLAGHRAPIASAEPLDISERYFITSLAIGDLNGDGHADLVVADSLGNLYILPGHGDGTFDLALPFYSGATESYILSTSFADVNNSLTVADFNKDGKSDIVLVLAGKSVSLLRNGAKILPVLATAPAVNAASGLPGPVAPGSIVSVYGLNLAYGSGSQQNQADSTIVLPLRLFGLSVTMDNVVSPLFYASPSQANLQVPWELAGKTQATVVATRNGAPVEAIVPISTYAPGLFTLNGAGSGQGAVLIAARGVLAAPLAAYPGSRPAHRGENISIYCTGLGPVTNQPATGAVSPGWPLSSTTSQPLVTIGSLSAGVQFSGLAPTAIGLYQVNVQVPPDAPVGNSIPVSLSIGGAVSNTIMIAID